MSGDSCVVWHDPQRRWEGKLFIWLCHVPAFWKKQLQTLAPGAADNCRVTLDGSNRLFFAVGGDCRAGSSAQLKYVDKMWCVVEVESILVSAENWFSAIWGKSGGLGKMVLSRNAIYFCGWRDNALILAGVMWDLCAAVQRLSVREEAASSCGHGSSGWLRWQGPLEMA